MNESKAPCFRNVLEIDDLTIHFATLDGITKVLHSIRLSLTSGNVMGLVGETGCGKSVTAEAILGTLPIPPAIIVTGRVLLKGQDLLSMDPGEAWRIRRETLAYVPQDPMTSLNPVFTVGQMMSDLIRWGGKHNLTPLDFTKVLFLRNRKEKRVAVELLERVNIPSPDKVIDQYPVELSGGMRQRVLIALSLIGTPALLVADEPTTALDVTIERTILELLENMVKEQGLAMLYITHNLGVARRICHIVSVMYAGEIVEMGRVKDLLSDPKHPYSIGLVRSVPKLTGTAYHGIEGRIPDYLSPPEGCRFYPRCKRRIHICATTPPPRITIKNNRMVLCHLYKDDATNEA